jgi:hypothetical protein
LGQGLILFARFRENCLRLIGQACAGSISPRERSGIRRDVSLEVAGMSEDTRPQTYASPPRRAIDTERDRADYAHRHFVNLVSAAFLLLLAAAMVWTVRAIDQQETTRKCFASGRKDCVELPGAPRDLRQAVR